MLIGHSNKLSDHCAKLDDKALADEIKRYIDLFVSGDIDKSVGAGSRHQATYILGVMFCEFTRRAWGRGYA